MSAAVIIPARYGSTRFPGKPLAADPSGRPMIQHVWDAARRAKGVTRVIVATDDGRIADAVRRFGGDVAMTAEHHACGSDRCAEAAAGLDEDIIVNLQGDEPGIPPDVISQVVALFEDDPKAHMTTLATRIRSEQELADPNCVKVVLDDRGRALYFSRSVIPHVRGSSAPWRESPTAHLLHLGIYGFRREALRQFAAFGSHPLEETEKLEQLRGLAHGFIIRVGLTEHRGFRVDTPEDFAAFCAAQSKQENVRTHS